VWTVALCAMGGCANLRGEVEQNELADEARRVRQGNSAPFKIWSFSEQARDIERDLGGY